MKNQKLLEKQRQKQLLLGIDTHIDEVVIKEKKWTEYIGYILWAVSILAMIAFSNIFKIVRVQGDSMLPNFENNQFVLLSRHSDVRRFDTVVLKERLETDGDVKFIIKRVIGLPGDVITVINGQLYINDTAYEETYLDEQYTQDFDNYDWSITVPENRYFVLGDNRDVSYDSRHVGSFIDTAVVGVHIYGGNTSD